MTHFQNIGAVGSSPSPKKRLFRSPFARLFSEVWSRLVGDTRALQGVLESCTLVKTYGNFRCPRVHPKSHARHIMYIYNDFYIFSNIITCILMYYTLYIVVISFLFLYTYSYTDNISPRYRNKNWIYAISPWN